VLIVNLATSLENTPKHSTEDKSKIQTTQKLNPTRKKQAVQNTAKQNYPGSVASYDTRPGNKTGLFYNTPELRRGEVM